MNRSEIHRHLESNSFEFTSKDPLLPYERYVVNHKQKEDQGLIMYGIVGSGGAQVTIYSHKALTSQPFVILKEVICRPTEHVYKAMDVGTIGRLTEIF